MFEVDYTRCIKAAQRGDIDRLIGLREESEECIADGEPDPNPWSEQVCTQAASKGYLDCLQYAHEHGCPWNEETCSSAAYRGHLNCLKYAYQNGCPWDKDTCTMAAVSGRLACLMFAHENGCPWYEETCSSAASNGHLACLEYANQNGCEWDERTCTNAALHDHLDCLEYAITHGCPISYKTICIEFLVKESYARFIHFYRLWPNDDLRKVTFWKDLNIDIPHRFIFTMDLHDSVYRSTLFLTDLSRHPHLQQKVERAKLDVEKRRDVCLLYLQEHITTDVCQFAICPYI